MAAVVEDGSSCIPGSTCTLAAEGLVHARLHRFVLDPHSLMPCCRDSSHFAASAADLQPLLPLLRLLRNSCALGTVAAALLLKHELHKRVANLAAALAVSLHKGLQQPGGSPGQVLLGGARPDLQQQQQQQQQQSKGVDVGEVQGLQQQVTQLLLAAVQLLSNLAATGAEAAAGVWAALFPHHLDNVLRVDDGGYQANSRCPCADCRLLVTCSLFVIVLT